MSSLRAFQNVVDEHSVAGVPVSLYNLTRTSVPDPLATFTLLGLKCMPPPFLLLPLINNDCFRNKER